HGRANGTRRRRRGRCAVRASAPAGSGSGASRPPAPSAKGGAVVLWRIHADVGRGGDGEPHRTRRCGRGGAAMTPPSGATPASLERGADSHRGFPPSRGGGIFTWP